MGKSENYLFLETIAALGLKVGLNNILFAIKYMHRDIYKSVQKRI